MAAAEQSITKLNPAQAVDLIECFCVLLLLMLKVPDSTHQVFQMQTRHTSVMITLSLTLL